MTAHDPSIPSGVAGSASVLGSAVGIDKDVQPDRPCTPPPTQLTFTEAEQLHGGSIILIDPTTSGIIGTLTPASPGSESTASESDSASTPVHQGSDSLPADRIPKRRDPTYSYRLSISDLSLRTFNAGPGDSCGDEDGYTCQAAQMSGEMETEAKAKAMKAARRSSWMTDDASFWTARGTLRMDGAGIGVGEGQEREREVVVAYLKTDTPFTDLFPPYLPTPSRPTPTSQDTPVRHRPAPIDTSATLRTTDSRITSLTASTDSPFPSRILHLFPRLSTLPRSDNSGSSGSGLPGGVTQGLGWPSMESMDAGTMMASAGSHAEAAFWRLVMPGISGIYGWTGILGSVYEQMASYLPIPLLSSSAPTDQAPLLIDSSIPNTSRHSHLYSEETIYTLRLPSSAVEGPDSLDIGPTAKPVWVRKRAALPVFVERDEPWGREGGRYHA